MLEWWKGVPGGYLESRGSEEETNNNFSLDDETFTFACTSAIAGLTCDNTYVTSSGWYRRWAVLGPTIVRPLWGPNLPPLGFDGGMTSIQDEGDDVDTIDLDSHRLADWASSSMPQARKKQPDDAIRSILRREQIKKVAYRLQVRLAFAHLKVSLGCQDLDFDSVVLLARAGGLYPGEDGFLLCPSHLEQVEHIAKTSDHRCCALREVDMSPMRHAFWERSSSPATNVSFEHDSTITTPSGTRSAPQSPAFRLSDFVFVTPESTPNQCKPSAQVATRRLLGAARRRLTFENR
ncbi:hypothetical protein PCL_12119 [Purpureocillium lilacinum]|uniref:Uncharacterized protein n=1 Tax=Purpureocillium lilacinum TaxID=33203 RepID=A0A2U3DPG8_PURLI|nr:hypothetical protein PCL_12119 [Purpureocillium lilacinum]